MGKPNKKKDALDAGMMAGVKAERAHAGPTVQERLNRVEGWAAPAQAEPVVVEKIVDRVVEVVKLVADRVPLENIKDRVTNIRVLSEARARRFAVSIAVVGLIQPPAIDRHSLLLAGDHRRRALAILRELFEHPERLAALLPGLDDEVKPKVLSAWRRFDYEAGVPVHRMDVDSEKQPDLAKSIELTENAQREDFTKEEFKTAYQQLRDAGFRETVQGRPKLGEKPMRPELALLFGKGERTISRYLAEIRANDAGPPAPEDPSLAALRVRLDEVFPGSTLNISPRGAWKLVIQGKALKDLDALLATRPSP
ncbi:MAG: hypothetical protein Q8O67_03220 [Deltaproteobacteria bacterium]|nr:hypothetical protein [Deltaproteobacteria bacterium]